jgi:hypothetical protein
MDDEHEQTEVLDPQKFICWIYISTSDESFRNIERETQNKTSCSI